MNPLDHTGQEFQLSLMNPNPKAARLKDGPRYRVEFEVDQETFDQFMSARELSGLVIECRAEVTALNEPIAGSAPTPPAPGKRATDITTEKVGTSVAASAPARVQSLAQRLHIDGYFRNPRLWNVLHQRAIYTMQEHKKFIEGMPCLFEMLRGRAWLVGSGSLLREVGINMNQLLASVGRELACEGDVCLHHVNSAALPAAGREQPEAPRKVPHFYGVPLCMNGHHTGWAHSKHATREEKEKLLEIAVALTAYRVKDAIKTYLGVEHLSGVTAEMLAKFELEIGFKDR